VREVGGEHALDAVEGAANDGERAGLDAVRAELLGGHGEEAGIVGVLLRPAT
jgi:hypothetical protein